MTTREEEYQEIMRRYGLSAKGIDRMFIMANSYIRREIEVIAIKVIAIRCYRKYGRVPIFSMEDTNDEALSRKIQIYREGTDAALEYLYMMGEAPYCNISSMREWCNKKKTEAYNFLFS